MPLLKQRPPVAPSPSTQLHPFKNPADLVNLLTTNSRNRAPNLSPLQCNAISAYRLLPSHRRPKEEYIKALFHISDDLFFFGNLKHKCTLEFPRFNWEGKGVRGDTDMSAFGGVVIRIFTRRDSADWWGVASTVLHEMVHACLILYIPHPLLRTLFPYGSKSLQCEGKTGHGFAWQDIAYALETAANDPEFMGMKLDLNRRHALKGELDRWRREPGVDLGKWGMAYKKG